MKEITQTGRIPFSAIGIILKNYLRWFKIVLVFYILPTLLILSCAYFLFKDKLASILQSLMIVTQMPKTPQTLEMVKTLVKSIFSPSLIIFALIAMIVGFVCYSCSLVGLKHTFYKKLSIVAVAKEGLKRIFGLLWTNISLFIFVFFFSMMAGFFSSFLVSISNGNQTISIISLILSCLFFIFVYTSTVFYIPIHFFAKNSPLSSMWYSFTTFWSNILFLIAFMILLLVVIIVVNSIFGIIIFFALKHYLPLPVPYLIMITYYALALISMIFPYTGLYSIFFTNILMIFVAYPELLEDENNDNAGSITGFGNEDRPISLNSHEQYPTSSDDFFSNALEQSKQKYNNSEIRIESIQLQQGQVIGRDSTSSFKTTTGGEGLSVPSNNHQNNRPFLNQKMDQTEFDRLTSKE